MGIFCAFAVLLGGLAPSAAQDWSQRCSAIARAHLIEHGIDPLDISNTVVIERPEVGSGPRRLRSELTQREAVNEGLIAGYTVRLRLQSCDGSILFEMGKRCQIQTLESRGDCEVPPSADPWAEENG